MNRQETENQHSAQFQHSPILPRLSVMDLNLALSCARSEFNLVKVGYRGFEKHPEVVALHQRCPRLKPTADALSSLTGNLELGLSLFQAADPADRAAMRGYFVGRVALEELSTQQHGHGGDKLPAFRSLLELTAL